MGPEPRSLHNLPLNIEHSETPLSADPLKATDTPVHLTEEVPDVDGSTSSRSIPQVGFVVLVVLGLVGLAGAVFAVEQYYRRDIGKTGQEQRLAVEINAPYGSVSIRGGANANLVASTEFNGATGDQPEMSFRYGIRNQYLGILHIGIGSDEGMLQQPLASVWRANGNFSVAQLKAPQSDMGSYRNSFTAAAAPWTDASGSAASPALPTPLRPQLPLRALPFRLVSTDAGTTIVPPDPSQSVTTISLTNDIPMNLQTDLGFGPSSLDLTGMRVMNLGIETGASNANIFTRAVNPIAMGTCQVNAGLGECTFTGISMLNAQRFVFSGGVGSYHLGFEGRLTRDLDAYISVGLGKCTISIPPLAGRVQVFYDDGLFSSFNFSGLVRRRDGYAVSAGFENSRSPVLTLHLSSGLGRMSISYH